MSPITKPKPKFLSCRLDRNSRSSVRSRSRNRSRDRNIALKHRLGDSDHDRGHFALGDGDGGGTLLLLSLSLGARLVVVMVVVVVVRLGRRRAGCGLDADDDRGRDGWFGRAYDLGAAALAERRLFPRSARNLALSPGAGGCHRDRLGFGRTGAGLDLIDGYGGLFHGFFDVSGANAL